MRALLSDLSKVSFQMDSTTEVGNFARYTVALSDSVTVFILYEPLI